MNNQTFTQSIEKAKAGELLLHAGPRAIIRLEGADRQRFLNGQVTARIQDMAEGSSLHTGITDAKGKLQGDGWILAKPNELQLDVPAVLGQALYDRLDRYLIADEVELSLIPGEQTVLHRLTGPLPGLVNVSGWSSTRFGQPGHDLLITDGDLSSFNVAPEEVSEAFRVANGYPRWGTDFTDKNLAPEALPDTSISYNKGCYIGQEVIARIKTIGRVNRRLVRLKAEGGDYQVSPSAVIGDNDQTSAEILSIPSATTGLEGNLIALAWVSRKALEARQTLHYRGIAWNICDL